VRKPERKECPLKSAALRPARRAYNFTRSATARPESRRFEIFPVLVTGRNSGPSRMPAVSIQVRAAPTGQEVEPDTIATVAPWPSWSVLLLRIVTRSPPLQNCISPTSSATSSERRNAPAKPSRRRARSRSHLRSVPALATIAATLSAVAGALRTGALPAVRRIPRSVALTASELVGGSWPVSL
jgi:hypothetical protein